MRKAHLQQEEGGKHPPCQLQGQLTNETKAATKTISWTTSKSYGKQCIKKRACASRS